MSAASITFWLGVILLALQFLSGLVEIVEQRGMQKQFLEVLFVSITFVAFIYLAFPLLIRGLTPGAHDEYFRKLNNYGLCLFALERRDADRPLPDDRCPEGGDFFYSEPHHRFLCTYPPHRAILLGETTPPEVFDRPW